jgi:hypothetical protein
VKWARAVHHLEAAAEACARIGQLGLDLYPWQVVELWAARDVLGSPRELEWVTVAPVIAAPVDEVPWFTTPKGAQAWLNATGLAKRPVVHLWRSAEAPVWNHRIERPVLVWSEQNGVAHEALAAIREGRGDSVRLPQPTPDELRARLEDERAVSLRALRPRADAYDKRRWSPGKIEPVADALWQAVDGYLDVLEAQRAISGGSSFGS